MSLESLIGVNDGPGLVDGIDAPEKDRPRLPTKDLMAEAALQRSFAQFDQRKRFDPFYINSNENLDVLSGPGAPGGSELQDVFSRYDDPDPPPSGGLSSGGDASPAGQSANPFDVGGNVPGPTAGVDRAGDFSPNVDPYGDDMREALRRLVRSS